MIFAIGIITFISLKISQYEPIKYSVLMCTIVLLLSFCTTKVNQYIDFGKSNCFYQTCVDSFEIYKAYYWVSYLSLIIIYILLIVMTDVISFLLGFKINFLISITSVLFFVFLLGFSPIFFKAKNAVWGGLSICLISFLYILEVLLPFLYTEENECLWLTLTLAFWDIIVAYLPSRRWLNIMEKKYIEK